MDYCHYETKGKTVENNNKLLNSNEGRLIFMAKQKWFEK